MALTVAVKEGDGFFVDAQWVVVERVRGLTDFVLRIGDTAHRVTERRATEIMTDVMVSAGRSGTKSWAKVVINAPQSIRITRMSQQSAVGD